MDFGMQQKVSKSVDKGLRYTTTFVYSRLGV